MRQLITSIVFLFSLTMLQAQCPTVHYPIVNGYQYINGVVPGTVYFTDLGATQVFSVEGYDLHPRLPEPSPDGYFQFNWKISTNGGNSYVPLEPECDPNIQVKSLAAGTLVMVDIWFVDKTAQFSAANNYFAVFEVPYQSVVKPGPIKPVFTYHSDIDFPVGEKEEIKY